jgi:hypothetical protein
MPEMLLSRTSLEIGQRVLRMQALQLPSRVENQHCNAQIEIAFSLLVYSNTPFDFNQKEFFGEGIATSIGTQTLPSYLAYGS